MALIEVASFSQTWIYIPPPAPLPYDLINAPREYFDDGPGGFETADLPKFLQTLRGRVLVTVTLDSVSIMDAAERPAQGPIVPIIIDGVTSDFLRANYNIAIGYPDSGPHEDGDVLYTPAPPAPPPLFDNNPNEVNFNQLNPTQKSALQSGTDRYHALGGDDTVTLPDSVGVVPGGYNAAKIFEAGPNNDKITGGKLDDHVDLGEGNDTLYGSPGRDVVTGGTGQDTFDYRSGKYANFAGFATGTVQLLSGGANLHDAPDLLKLPGAPGDYRYKVSLSSSWETTFTTVQKLRPDGSVAFTFDTKEIEKAEIQNPIANAVTLMSGSILAEVAQLAKQVYGNTGEVGHKWHAVSAMELGIKPKNFDLGLVNYTFKDGIYDATSLTSPLAHANAIVLIGVVDGQKTLSVAFRGTDQIPFDFQDFFPFTSHYAKFKPLIDGLKDYIAENQIDQVLVTGHSLGGAMVQLFMQDVVHPNMKGYTFGSPGADDWSFSDNRIVNFIHTGDPVPLAAITGLPPLTDWLKHRLGSDISINTSFLKFGPSNGNIDPFTEHYMNTYQFDVTSLIDLAGVNPSPFYGTAVAESLRSGIPYTGPDVQIAPGTNGNDEIVSDADDNFVLGGAGADTIRFETSLFGLAQTGLTATSTRVIDGSAGSDSLFLPYGKSLFQAPTNDGGNLFFQPIGGNAELVGILYSINTIVYNGKPAPGPTASQVASLSAVAPQAAALQDDGISIDVLDVATGTYKAASGQTAKAGQTTMNVDPTKDYTDAGDGNLTVIGTAGNNIVVAGTGNKTIQAGAGNDIILVQGNTATAGGAALAAVAVTEKVLIDGGIGADVMAGGTSDTTYYVDNTGDEVLEDEGGGLDLVRSSVNYTLSAHVERLTLTGAAATEGMGNDDANLITGNGAANVLSGLGGDDTLIGGLGNDTLNGGAGADRLDGGAGIDTSSYSAATEGVTVDLTLTGPQVSAGEASGDVLISIEILIGGAGNDTLTGNSSNNVLEGGAGADHLDGGAGTDTASYAGSGPGVNASLMAGIGSGGDALGDTFLNIENLTGSNFDDVLEGNGGNNVLVGGTNGLSGDTASYANATVGVTVSLATTLAQNTIGAGIDTLLGFENVTVSAFNDKLTGSSLANVLAGGAGNDLLMGGAGNDTLQGGADDDVLIGGAGPDALDGGGGNDTASYAGSAVAVTVDLNAGTGLGGDAQGDTLTGIENLIGSAFNDTLTGDGNDNVLTGGAGKDTLAGGLNGAGGDTASYATATAGVTVSLLLQGGAQNAVGAGVDTLTGIENLIGSAFNDALTGDGNNNVLTGAAGNDMLLGGAGDDALDGGAGTMDTASYATAGSGVTVSLATAGAQDTVGAGIDTLIGIERLIGSSSNDTLTGDGLANRIDGGAGDDTIDGGAGNDILIGGANGAAGDTLSYASGAGGVTASLAIQDGVTAQNTLGAGTDTLSGFENLTGSAFNDTLTGNGLANRIDGGAGNDIINGGAGNDNLQGGAGTDTMKGGVGNDMLTGGTEADAFVFNTALNAMTNVDDVTDFQVGIDHIGLENSIFTKLAATGALSAESFHVGTSAADSNDFIIYDDATGALYYDSNGSAAGQQVQFAHLNSSLTLTHTDFFVV